MSKRSLPEIHTAARAIVAKKRGGGLTDPWSADEAATLVRLHVESEQTIADFCRASRAGRKTSTCPMRHGATRLPGGSGSIRTATARTRVRDDTSIARLRNLELRWGTCYGSRRAIGRQYLASLSPVIWIA